MYVVDGGSIVKSGSHDELMEQQGTHARLFNRPLAKVSIKISSAKISKNHQ